MLIVLSFLPILGGLTYGACCLGRVLHCGACCLGSSLEGMLGGMCGVVSLVGCWVFKCCLPFGPEVWGVPLMFECV